MPIPNRTLPIANWLMQQLANKLQKEEQDIKTKGTKQYFKDKGNQAVRVVGENMPYFIPGSQAYMELKAVDDFQNGNNVGGAVGTGAASLLNNSQNNIQMQKRGGKLIKKRNK